MAIVGPTVVTWSCPILILEEQEMSWVIYHANHKHASGVNCVCEQKEWEEMTARRSDFYTLVQGGFPSESDAEKAARPVDPPKPIVRPRG